MEEDFSFHGENPPFMPPGFLSLGDGRMDHEDSTILDLHALEPPPRTPPQLPDGIIEDIFLRVPPHDHARLLRVALACKHWACLIADRSFRRWYRERHGQALVMLGFLANIVDTGGMARFVPTCAFRPVCPDGYRVQDSRHGRVLLHQITMGHDVPQGQDDTAVLIVWDPITNQQEPLPLLQRRQQVLHWNAVVLCGAGGICDHLDCHSGPSLIVFVGMDADEMFAHTYSSKYGAWGWDTSAPLPDDPLILTLLGPLVRRNPLDESSCAALARNALYFLFIEGTRMLKYDLATGILSVVALPFRPIVANSTVLMTMEDGELGFAEVVFQNVLRLWAMEAGGWTKRRVIELSSHLPPHALMCSSSVVAFADATGVIFLKTHKLWISRLVGPPRLEE